MSPVGKLCLNSLNWLVCFMGHFDSLIHAWRGLTAVVYGRMQHECAHSPV